MALTEHAIYQHWTDNVARDAALFADPGTDDEYGPENLVDDNPAKVSRIEATTGAWGVDYGSAQRLDLVGLIHHSFDAGADVKIQANSSNSWGSPAFQASFTIPAWLGTGSQPWPVNPWLDLTTKAGYSATGWRWWRILVTGNSQNLELGQLWMSPTIRRFDPDVKWGVNRGFTKRMVENLTASGVAHVISRQTTQWSENGVLMAITDEMADALHTQWFDVDGRALPWLLVPDGEVNACYLVRWTTPEQQWQWNFQHVRDFPIQVQEVSRGLRPGT